MLKINTMGVRRKGYQIFISLYILAAYSKANTLNDWKLKYKLIDGNKDKNEVMWPNGIISYYFDSKSYDHVIALRLRSAMNLLESVSCIKFIPIIGTPSRNATWLHISNPRLERECMHELLYKDNGEMILVLGLDCLSEQQILHTLLHGVGFKDEVSHPQRDQFVRILWSNIQPAFQHLFHIQTNTKMSKSVIEYDPMSVMHFHDRAFSINGQATIAPLMAGLVITPSDSLSQLDKMKLQLLYGHECNKRNVDDLLEICKKVLHQDINKDEFHNKPPEDEDSVIEEGSNTSGNNTNSFENSENNEENADDIIVSNKNETLSQFLAGVNKTDKLEGDYKRVKECTLDTLLFTVPVPLPLPLPSPWSLPSPLSLTLPQPSPSLSPLPLEWSKQTKITRFNGM